MLCIVIFCGSADLTVDVELIGSLLANVGADDFNRCIGCVSSIHERFALLAPAVADFLSF